uniref:H(+)-transporting ATPase subunit 4 n=1 Tax=Acanthamoeba castellanii TaxID=5755 RepID=A0A0K1HQA7_ACACA|nr:H(+)-transporting ATPase subunit 4 [Acanthamoeba castellanii]
MKYSLLLFFILFAINNLLHYISEKVIIVIFIVFLFFLMNFLSNIINSEFKLKIDYILNDINTYVNVVFNFLYINKLFYLNLKSFKKNFLSLNCILNKKVRTLKFCKILNNKLNKINSTSNLLLN